MNSFQNIMTAIAIPILILNVLGGIVSGIWLAFLGDWNAILIGFVLFIISTFLINILLIPSLIFIIPVGICIKNRSLIGCLFWGALNNIYTNAIITLWCCGTLFVFMNNATESNFIPRLIWSYGIATGPWAYLASKEEDNFASSNGTFMAEIAYIIIMIIILFYGIQPIDTVKIFSGFMIFGIVLNLIFAFFMQKEEFDKLSYNSINSEYLLIDKNDDVSYLTKEDIEISLKKGINCFKTAEYQEALNHFEEVIQNDPKNKVAYYGRAVSNYKIGNKESVISDLIKSAKLGYKKAQDKLDKLKIEY